MKTGASLTHNPVILIEDDADVRGAIVQTLELAGIGVSAFSNGATIPERIGDDFPGVVVTDIRLPGRDGREIFRTIHERAPDVPVILITGHAHVQEAVDLVREGAFDFLSKPFPPARLTESVRAALDQRQLRLENRRLRLLPDNEGNVVALMGSSPRMAGLRAAVKQVANTDVNVLIVGETGTGKAAVAKELHRVSRRASRPFMVLDCASLPDTMLETELFGSESLIGGMTRRRPGRLEAAEDGTLLLDNVDLMTPASQGRLLRAVEEKEITPIGGTRSRSLSCRIVAATTRALDVATPDSGFRPDLFFRLAGVTLALPPLRERRDDIPRLYVELLRAAAKRLRREAPDLTSATRAHLVAHGWPGNLRELNHFAERILLGLDDLAVADSPERESLHSRVDRFEAEMIIEAAQAAAGDVKTCLKLLGLPRKTFYDKLAKFNIDLAKYRRERSNPSR